MNKTQKNIIYIIIIIFLTIAILFILSQMPNFSKQPQEQNLPLTLKFIWIFLLADIIFISLPTLFHYLYVNDYQKISSLWFFTFSGAIIGILLGEQMNFIMLMPYLILMFIYALFYKYFIWWKVALSSYLAGIIIENIINRSPLQSPTLIWIGFFTFPFFLTKIWENRNKLSFKKIFRDFWLTIIITLILTGLAIYFSSINPSPPLILLALTIPLLLALIYKVLKKIYKKSSYFR